MKVLSNGRPSTKVTKVSFRPGTFRCRNTSKILSTRPPNGAPVRGSRPPASRRSSSASWVRSCSMRASIWAMVTCRTTRIAATMAAAMMATYQKRIRVLIPQSTRRARARSVVGVTSVVGVVSPVVVIVVSRGWGCRRKRRLGTRGGRVPLVGSSLRSLPSPLLPLLFHLQDDGGHRSRLPHPEHVEDHLGPEPAGHGQCHHEHHVPEPHGVHPAPPRWGCHERNMRILSCRAPRRSPVPGQRNMKGFSSSSHPGLTARPDGRLS